MTAPPSVTVRIVERRVLPITRLAVHQHFHHTASSRPAISPSYSTVSSTAIYVTVRHRNVPERILVKRVLEARPLDAAHETLVSASTTMRRPVVERVESRPVATHLAASAGNGGRPAMARSQRRRVRTVETRHVAASRAHLETTHVTRSTQVRDTRWRQAIDVRLDWRQAPQPATHEGTSAAMTEGSAPAAAPTRTSGEASAPAPVPATQAPRRETAPAAFMMDRATFDRLADNVMQRIERQVRIERERRGL